MALSYKNWTERAARHHALISPLADAFLKRRELGKTHAVHDFLFTYYSFSPQKLKQWVPAFYEDLEVTPEFRNDYPWFTDHWFEREGDVLSPKRERMGDSVRGLATFVHDLCQNIINRAPRFGCFGLHEWAMVYKLSAEELRHKSHTLRMTPEALATFVESQTISCSHYDAYRFFTEPAKPFNVLNPQIENRLQLEQGGCLHANMDLYKWGLKLWPWIGSDFLAKAFFLALEGRELDMRASPYDLKEAGYTPICIETEAGRLEYQQLQKKYAEKANLLRGELLNLTARLKNPDYILSLSPKVNA